jgi:hypothetical protein
MKMHTTITAMILALAIPCSASLLDSRAKLEGAKQEAEAAAAAATGDAELAAVATDKAQALTDFDAKYAAKFGPGWLTRWQNSEYDNPDDEAVDIYINDGPVAIATPGISGAKKKELLEHIAAKPVLVPEDLASVMLFRQHTPDLADRIEEFAALLPSDGIRDVEYFRVKHLGIGGHPGGGLTWTKHMSTADWFDLASADAPFQPAVYAAMRDYLLAQSARLLIDKRTAGGQPVEGPEFDAAIAPVVVALDAPKFNGLADAVTALGIDLEIPAPDYTAQEAVAAAVESAAANRTKFTTAWGAQVQYQEGLGSVMLVKGKAAYTAWRDGLLASQ